jgi:hypothetical protein
MPLRLIFIALGLVLPSVKSPSAEERAVLTSFISNRGCGRSNKRPKIRKISELLEGQRIKNQLPKQSKK